MASNITVQSVLEEISRGHLLCPICSERFKQPKLLECLHSYCLECLQQLRQTSSSTTKLVCPVCRQETLLKENDFDDLKTDITAISLIEAIEKQETQLKQQQVKQLPGRECFSKCSKHTDKDLIMYCSKCKELICTACMLSSHKSHSLMEINEASGNCKQHATELVAKIGQNIETFNIAIQEIDMSRTTLDSMFAATKEKISKKADEEKNKLMQEAEQIYKQRVKTIEIAHAANYIKMKKAEHQKDDVNLIMDQESCEIVNQMEQLLKDLKEYKQMKPTKLTDGLTFMDFKEGQKSLGKLVVKDEQPLQSAASAVARKLCEINHFVKNIKQNTRWTLKSEIEMFDPHDVAAYSNSDVVVSQRDSASLIIISAESNPQSTVIPQKLPIKGLTGQSRVTVNSNDELIVLNNEAVNIFSENYQLLHQFKPGSHPICIAVDDNNLIAVGYGYMDEISLHKPDGSLIRTLPAPGIGDYLTTYKQRLIYIKTKWDAKLVSVDYNGDLVFSEDINQPGLPCGVCCDKDGNIYVAVKRRCSSSFEIHHYSPDGKYFGRIIKGCSGSHNITFTPAGYLIVAANNSVEIYHYG